MKLHQHRQASPSRLHTLLLGADAMALLLCSLLQATQEAKQLRGLWASSYNYQSDGSTPQAAWTHLQALAILPRHLKPVTELTEDQLHAEQLELEGLGLVPAADAADNNAAAAAEGDGGGGGGGGGGGEGVEDGEAAAAAAPGGGALGDQVQVVHGGGDEEAAAVAGSEAAEGADAAPIPPAATDAAAAQADELQMSAGAAAGGDGGEVRAPASEATTTASLGLPAVADAGDLSVQAHAAWGPTASSSRVSRRLRRNYRPATAASTESAATTTTAAEAGSLQTSDGAPAGGSGSRVQVHLQVLLPIPQSLQLQPSAPQQCLLPVSAPASATAAAVASSAAVSGPAGSPATAAAAVASASAMVATAADMSRECAVNALVQYAAARAEQLTNSHGSVCKCRCRTPPVTDAAPAGSADAEPSNRTPSAATAAAAAALDGLSGGKRSADEAEGADEEVMEAGPGESANHSGSRKRMRSETPCTPALASRLVQQERVPRAPMQSRHVGASDVGPSGPRIES